MAVGKCDKEEFLHSVVDHEMEILLDQGVHRHLKFSASGELVGHFHIVTWPGSLCIHGDMGCYVFTRTEDMFDFFGANQDRVNLPYWAEKLEADAMYTGSREFDPERLRDAVKEHFESWVDSDPELHEGRQRAIWRELEESVLTAETEEEAIRAAAAFNCWGCELTDFWEVTLTSYTYQFHWCLRAIVWAIEQYTEHHASTMA